VKEEEEENPPTLSIVSETYLFIYSMTQFYADSLASINRGPGIADYATPMKHFKCLSDSGMELILFLRFFCTPLVNFRAKYQYPPRFTETFLRAHSPTLFILFIYQWLTGGHQLEEINFS
jgi:hypothetical protein